MPPDAVVCHRIDRTTRVVRWMRRLGVIFLLTVCGLMIGNVAHAFWTAGGEGFGLAETGRMNPSAAVLVSSPSGSDTVSVSWNQAALDPTGTVEGYFVTRLPAEGGEPTPACGTTPTGLTVALQCDDAGVPDGLYRYVVTAVLGSWTAESAPSDEVAVRLNTSYPSVVATTSPAPNTQGYNNSSPVTVQLAATDSDGVAFITYRINGGAPVTVNAATASIPLSGHGTYTVTYSATDTLGGTSPTASRVVRIDMVAPAAPAAPTLVASSDTGVSSTDGVTSVRSPTVTGTTEPFATVQFYSGGTLAGAATAGPDGTYVATSGFVLADGTYSVIVRAIDQAGNVGPFSSALTLTIDGTAPSTPTAPALTTASDTGRSTSDRITNDATPTFSGTGSSGSVGVRLYRGGVEVGTTTASPAYSTLTASGLADGVHSMTVRVFDLAGNLSGASGALSVTIDTVAPAAPSAPVLTTASDTGASSTDRITRDSTPTVTGSTEASSEVRLYAGSIQVGSHVTGTTVYSTTSSTLTDGDHTLTVTATDAAGNLGPASSGTTITIDTVAPAAPSAPLLSADSDSGSSSSDRITNDNTPTFSGTATVNSNVTLFDGTTSAAAPVLTASGSWTSTTSPLSDGVHSITARTDPDLAGNVGVSPITTVTIDTTAPAQPNTPSLTLADDSGRSNGDWNTNVKTPSFFGTGTAGAVGMRLYAGAGEVGAATTNPGYAVTAVSLGDGVHSISVRVLDAAGNLSVASVARALTIDTAAPAAPSAPTLAAGNDTGSSSTDRVTNVAAPTMTGTTEASAIVTLFDGATQVGSQTTAGTSYSITSSSLSDGVHTMTTRATDIAGNVGPASTSTSITIDTVAPAAPSTPVLSGASDSGVSSNDRVTNNTTPTFTGTATAGSGVTLYDGSSPTGQRVTATGGAWTATTQPLSNGARTITARTDPDLAGNVGISSSVVVTIDTVAPSASITVGSSAAVRFRFTFSEAVHGFTSSDIPLSGTGNPTSATISGSGPGYDVVVSGMDRSGTVIVSLPAAQVTDTAGNNNVASTSTTINYVDNVAPAVAVTQFFETNSTKVQIDGTAGTSPGDPSTVTVVVCTSSEVTCQPANTKATFTATVNPSTGAWTVSTGPLGVNPALYARVRATDLSGNTGTSAAAGPIAIR